MQTTETYQVECDECHAWADVRGMGFVAGRFLCEKHLHWPNVTQVEITLLWPDTAGQLKELVTLTIPA